MSSFPESERISEGPSGMSIVVSAVIIAAGLAAAGYFIASLAPNIGPALVQARLADRVVTVKGLAERNVKADLALWEIRHTATGNDLAQAQSQVEAGTSLIKDFLSRNGLPAEAITSQKIDVIDLLAQQYRSENAAQSRFIVTATLMIRTNDVDLVQKLSSSTGELIKYGVIFANEGPTGPYFLFTKLNDVKLEMIAEATKNARAAAEQFAEDSGAAVGGIYRASQGQFSILPGDNWPGADESRQISKTVRVVSTVDYRLLD